jgi:hypothetical protein
MASFLKYILSLEEEERFFDKCREESTDSYRPWELVSWFTEQTGLNISIGGAYYHVSLPYDKDDPTFGQSALVAFRLRWL